MAKSKNALKRAVTSTHYELLGVPRNANEETIRTAFRKAAKSYHPDLNAGDPVAAQLFQQVVAAYELLKNPALREAYDLQLKTDRRARLRRFMSSIVSATVGGCIVAVIMWWSSYMQNAPEPAEPPRVAAMVGQPESQSESQPQSRPEGQPQSQPESQPETSQAAAGNDDGNAQDDEGRRVVAAVAMPDETFPDNKPPQPAAPSSEAPTGDQPDAQVPSAAKWQHALADGDPTAIWEFAARNPDAPEAQAARARLFALIDNAQDVFLLQVLSIDATDAIAKRARQRLVRVGAVPATDGDKGTASNLPADAVISLERRAANFVTQQISGWSSTSAHKLAVLTKAYADDVLYNGGLKSRQAVIGQKRRLLEQWPERTFTVQRASIRAECVGNTCRVSGVTDWQTRNAPRATSASGSEQFEYGVLFSRGAFSILSESISPVKHSGQASRQ